MTDPLSIAELAIAIIDLWTGAVVQDVRTFDKVYGGNTFFDQFELDVQQQTIQLLEESEDTRFAAHNLLHRRYNASLRTSNSGTETLVTPASTPPNLTLTPTVSSTSQAQPKWNSSLSTVIAWSLRDKKRVESLIHKFNEQNNTIQDTVKLWCLGNQLGVNSEHLHRSQIDEGSEKLDFFLDATLRLTQHEAVTNANSLELPELEWDSLVNPCLRFRRFAHLGKTQTYTSKRTTYTNHQSGGFLAVVATPEPLTHKPQVASKLLPISYTNQRSDPISLHELLGRDLGYERVNPELGDRFRLAAGLATCVAQSHMVGWLHESLRSENILFFTDSDDAVNLKTINFAEPLVLSFEFARQDIDRSVFEADFEPTRDIYRYPERQGAPQVSFRKCHDVYALGVILLGIGLWKPAVSLQMDNFRHAKLSDKYTVAKQLLHHADNRLERRFGRRYKEIVVKCMMGDFGIKDDNRENLKLQQAFRSKFVDVLERAADAV